MAKRRNTILVIGRRYRGIESKKLAPTFMSGVLSKVCRENEVKVVVLSYDDGWQEEPDDSQAKSGARIVRLRSSSGVKGMTRTPSDSEFWPGEGKVATGKEVVSRSLKLAQIGREVAKLLPVVRVVHWLEPIAPWNGVLSYLLKSRGVRSYMSIFYLHRRFLAHYQLLRMTLAGLEKVVVSTAGLQRVVSKDVGIPAQDTVHIPLGVDLELYKPCADKSGAKRRLGICDDHRVFSWFGPIQPGIPMDFSCALSAADYIHERCPASFFIFAFKEGFPPKLGPCGDWMRLYEDLDHIRDILAATDAAILPFSDRSWEGGLPLTIVEALASGVPVITTNRGKLDETITDGFNGLLVQDPEDVCQAALSLCDAKGKLNEMSRNARLVAVRRFDLKTVAQAYVDLWDG